MMMQDIDYEVNCKVCDWGIEFYKPQEKTNVMIQFGALVFPKGDKPDPKEYLRQHGVTKYKFMA